jgi:endonuclease YncB( thermonuclease family)
MPNKPKLGANDPRRISTSARKIHVIGPRAVLPVKIWRPDSFKNARVPKRAHTIRRCQILSIVDGDTCDAWVENGLEEMPYKRIRVRSYDAPSIEDDASAVERALGIKAKIRAEELLLGKIVECDFGAESQIYGRMLASITYYIGKTPYDFGSTMIAEHLSVSDVVR